MLKAFARVLLIAGFSLILLALFMPSTYQDARLLNVPFSPTSTQGKIDPIIRLHAKNDMDSFFCTGFVIDDNYALTAGHCVNSIALIRSTLSTTPIYIYKRDGSYSGITAFAAGMDDRRDLGIIRGDFSQFRKVKIDTSLLPARHIFRTIKACGFPSGQKELVCSPVEPMGVYYFQYAGSCVLYPGMSGGPVFDVSTGWRVIGINSAMLGELCIFSPLKGIFANFNIEPSATTNALLSPVNDEESGPKDEK